MKAYQWLSNNYEPDDDIYLFGEELFYRLLACQLRTSSSRIFTWSLSSANFSRNDQQGELKYL